VPCAEVVGPVAQSFATAPFWPAAIAARSNSGGGVSPPIVPEAELVVSESLSSPTAPRFSVVLSTSATVAGTPSRAARGLLALGLAVALGFAAALEVAVALGFAVTGTWLVLGRARGTGGGPDGTFPTGRFPVVAALRPCRGLVSAASAASRSRSLPSVSSAIFCSSALRSGDPGGGGGTVFWFRRGASRATSLGRDASRLIGSGAGGDSPSTVQPDANSAMRPFVSSPRRRGFRSSSGTPARR
jgi:hypothetical protein